MTAASARGVARLVADAAHGIEVVVTRHHKPVAAVVGVERLAELDAIADDLRDLALVIARAADDDGRRTRSPTSPPRSADRAETWCAIDLHRSRARRPPPASARRAARRALERIALLDADARSRREPGDDRNRLPEAQLARRNLAVVYAVDADVVTVWEVWVDGVRSTGAAYAEALQRMVSADAPDAVELAGILERLGRITGTVPVPRTASSNPSPTGSPTPSSNHVLTRLEVAAMDATTAFEAWNTAPRLRS